MDMFYERMMVIGWKCITLEIEGGRQSDRLEKTWREVVDKDENDLHLKPNDAMDRHNWREVIRGNWSDINIDSGPWAEYEFYVSAVGSPTLT